MSLKLFDNDGLIQTKIHGLEQNAYVITEDKMDSFNNYSFDLQMYLALFSLFFGAFLSSLLVILTSPNSYIIKIIFYCSLCLMILLAILLIKSYLKFKKVRARVFIKIDELPNILDKSLKIVKATYGTKDKNIDISSYLKEKINNNSLDVKISNDIAGDPAPTVNKEAEIQYSLNGEEKTVIIKENDSFKLP